MPIGRFFHRSFDKFLCLVKSFVGQVNINLSERILFRLAGRRSLRGRRRRLFNRRGGGRLGHLGCIQRHGFGFCHIHYLFHFPQLCRVAEILIGKTWKLDQFRGLGPPTSVHNDRITKEQQDQTTCNPEHCPRVAHHKPFGGVKIPERRVGKTYNDILNGAQDFLHHRHGPC